MFSFSSNKNRYASIVRLGSVRYHSSTMCIRLGKAFCSISVAAVDVMSAMIPDIKYHNSYDTWYHVVA